MVMHDAKRDLVLLKFLVQKVNNKVITRMNIHTIMIKGSCSLIALE